MAPLFKPGAVSSSWIETGRKMLIVDAPGSKQVQHQQIEGTCSAMQRKPAGGRQLLDNGINDILK